MRLKIRTPIFRYRSSWLQLLLHRRSTEEGSHPTVIGVCALYLCTLSCAFTIFWGPVLEASSIKTLQVRDIHVGMIGEGRTVFAGNNIETFEVTILGILNNFGPHQDMILARLDGGPLAHTGVIAGMSGSPVYIDGSLIGAIAYAFPFAKDPIAGITPIHEMFDATATPNRRQGLGALTFPLTPNRLAKVIPPTLKPIPLLSASLQEMNSLSPYLGRMLTPIATPASVHGFTGAAFDIVAPYLRSLGIEPLMVSAATQSASYIDTPIVPKNDNVSLRPGDAVGVGLLTGDLEISATGTVTYVEPLTGVVYALGHPLFNLGPIEYPMKKSIVHLVLPSLMNSFKMTSSTETIGTWTQDRITAIKGVLHARPKMIPMSVLIKTSRLQEKQYKLEIVDDELFSPVLAFTALVAIFQATERQFGSQTFKVSAWLSTTDNRKIRIEDVFANRQAAMNASAIVSTPMSILMSNEFQEIGVDDIQVEVQAFEDLQTARLMRAWIEPNEITPGKTIRLKLLLKTYRGEEVLDMVDISVPENVGQGQVKLIVADAATLSSIERQEAKQSFQPRDLEQLIRAINSLRKNNRLYVRLMRSDRKGAIVSGEYLTSLPPSVMDILETDDSSSGFIPLQNSMILEQEVTTEFSVSGSRLLTVEVVHP